jgi:aryl-alcohol dehydrogenase-like predicted oxidoreductase
MNYRYLGKTGVKVSELCLGTMTFGGKSFWKNIGDVDQNGANTIVNMAVEGGINFFDTADVYSEGMSEELLGKALGAKRKDIVLATKLYGRKGPGPNDVGSSRLHIISACEASLKRLGTDYIDLYQVHHFDRKTPLEETMRALDDLVRQGKVRYIGCSNFSGWHLMKSISLSRELHLEQFVTTQNYYSLIARELEFEIVPLCLDQNLGILLWSPLAGGFLTGKFRRGKPRPQGVRRASTENNFLQFDEEKGFDIIEELDRIGKSHNATVTQAALNYLLRKPAVSSVIIGVRSVEQLKDDLNTVNWVITPEEVARLDQLSAPPRIYPYWMQEFAGRER